MWWDQEDCKSAICATRGEIRAIETLVADILESEQDYRATYRDYADNFLAVSPDYGRFLYAVARACDAGRTTRFDAAGAILLASESAVKVAGEAIQALGGAGYTKEWPVERLLRDAKLYDIGAGTNEIRRFLIGRELLGS